jgi:hypothetical protein
MFFIDYASFPLFHLCENIGYIINESEIYLFHIVYLSYLQVYTTINNVHVTCLHIDLICVISLGLILKTKFLVPSMPQVFASIYNSKFLA